MGKVEQTPVEWLWDLSLTKELSVSDFEQAKEMEIQQKIKQFDNAFKEGQKQSKCIYIY
jgi:hypothetical protein